MRNTVFLNFGWDFSESFDKRFLNGEGGNHIKVDLPHTVKETPFHYFDESVYQMVSGYRRKLRLPEGAEKKRVFLIVEAAAHYAEIFIDGELLCTHKGGYTAFECELTGKLSSDKDALLCIKVDSRESLNIPPFGKVIDYMTYGGLYRGVQLEVREQSYIKNVFAVPTVPGTVSLSENADKAEIEAISFDGEITCKTKVENGEGCEIRHTVCAYRSDIPLSQNTGSTVTVKGAKLWDVLSPALYTLKTELIKDDTVIDCVETAVGFRRAEFRKDGFFLNGRRLKIVGLNRHQSYPYVGYAMPKSVQRYDAEILKFELGLNAVRTSHYPQSQHFIDRCDELGLLVFTEIPGWQHIGDDEWKKTAIGIVGEMVTQYRNHPSIILWGVRINESRDDDDFYRMTNAVARALDPTRPTGGVRYIKKSSLLEDVYTYNDFSHTGSNIGCEEKKDVTPDMEKPYLISEYNGHMYPTKSFDNEELRTEHALRHARVLDAVASADDICGSFGWCFSDYNTHRDFGSGDRVCYHGVCDMFRNRKLAASVYAVRQDETPVLEVSSSMDIGEHPGSIRGRIYLFTNCDAVRFYKNDTFIKEYTHRDASLSHLFRPPIEISDFIGDRIKEGEDFTPKQAQYIKELLNCSARFGMNDLPLDLKRKAAWLLLRYKMSFEDAYALYGKYIENWGSEAASYTFEGIKDGKVVKTVVKESFSTLRLSVSVSHTELFVSKTYDAAAVRIRAVDQNGNILPFFSGVVTVKAEGEIGLIGPDAFTLQGGMGGCYIRTTGTMGKGKLTIATPGADDKEIDFLIHNA